MRNSISKIDSWPWRLAIWKASSLFLFFIYGSESWSIRSCTMSSLSVLSSLMMAQWRAEFPNEFCVFTSAPLSMRNWQSSLFQPTAIMKQVSPCLSGLLTSAPFSARHLTTSMFFRLQAYNTGVLPSTEGRINVCSEINQQIQHFKFFWGCGTP